MYPSVRDQFPSFIQRFEGRVPYMYLDTEGFVTIGVGNKIDPVSDALALPFIRKSDLSTATEAEIQAEWELVKSRTDLSNARDYRRRFDGITNLKLKEDFIDQLVPAKLQSNEAILKETAEFSDLEGWPADAQLGLFNMAWSLGAGFGKFEPPTLRPSQHSAKHVP